MSFRTWLFSYRGDAAIMAIASDAELNPPHGLWSHDDLKQHVIQCGAPDAYVATLDCAIDLWRRTRESVAETTKPL